MITERRRQQLRAAQARYEQTPKGKATQYRYDKSVLGKARKYRANNRRKPK